MKQSIDAVASNLKNMREERGLSLDQLSEITDVSKSMLRQIETGKSSPTISTIWKIANGLHISFTALLRKNEVKAEVRSFKESQGLTAMEDHYRLYPLIPFDPAMPFETYYFEIDPETSFKGEPHKGNVTEYVFVTEGTLEMILEDKSYTINSGEFLQFHADCDHTYKCIGSSATKAIMQLSYIS